MQRLQAECDDVIRAYSRLRADLPELLRRSEHAVRDGYPTTSLGASGGANAVNRPTESTALAGKVPDPVRSGVKRMLALLSESTRDATSLETLRESIMGSGGVQTQLETCDTCGDAERRRLRDHRCWACFEYKRRTSRERPRELWRASV